MPACGSVKVEALDDDGEVGRSELPTRLRTRGPGEGAVLETLGDRTRRRQGESQETAKEIYKLLEELRQ